MKRSGENPLSGQARLRRRPPAIEMLMRWIFFIKNDKGNGFS